MKLEKVDGPPRNPPGVLAAATISTSPWASAPAPGSNCSTCFLVHGKSLSVRMSKCVMPLMFFRFARSLPNDFFQSPLRSMVFRSRLDNRSNAALVWLAGAADRLLLT